MHQFVVPAWRPARTELQHAAGPLPRAAVRPRRPPAGAPQRLGTSACPRPDRRPIQPQLRPAPVGARPPAIDRRLRQAYARPSATRKPSKRRSGPGRFGRRGRGSNRLSFMSKESPFITGKNRFPLPTPAPRASRWRRPLIQLRASFRIQKPSHPSCKRHDIFLQNSKTCDEHKTIVHNLPRTRSILSEHNPPASSSFCQFI